MNWYQFAALILGLAAIAGVLDRLVNLHRSNLSELSRIAELMERQTQLLDLIESHLAMQGDLRRDGHRR